ncbi:MAG TPA: helix-turn-helix domain-containing protein [Trebonia sp.]
MNAASGSPGTGAVTMGPGVLHAKAAAARFTLSRYPPPAGLEPFVDFCWVIRWDLSGQPPHEQAILPHPNVNLAFEAKGAAVFGVDTKIFTRRLSGQGKALGVRFRPGGFRPFYGKPVFTLNDRVVPAHRILGEGADQACALVMADTAGDDAMIEAAAALLRGARPAEDPVAGQVAELTALITREQGLYRVAQLAEVSGLPARRLQRMFAEYVGVSPKWVMRRARLHEAALRAEAAGPAAVNWAALAAELGYSDQAHLTRDFTDTIGVPPTRYASG